MADDVQFTSNWSEDESQCRNCKFFKEHEGQTACVPEGMTFEKALEEYGACPPDGHCNYFTAK